MKVKKMVIGYILDGDKVLLIYKKRGFGKGLYNGFGGKLENGEGSLDALKREGYEELSIKILEAEYCGKLFFYDDNKLAMDCDVYIVKKYSGKPKESEEVKPMWFDLNEIPFDKMWEDDKYWLKHLLKEEKFMGKFYFTDLFGENPRLLSHEITLYEE